MQSLVILAIVALVVALIIAIVVRIIVIIKCIKLKRQKHINWLINKIKKKAENSGNKSKGNKKKLSTLVKIEHHAP
uniref:Protein Vpu n=1 Tax=Human immunodeficiency virus type 1 TaxID=11676 RepID=B5LQ62_HV1|nr:vpu protein [Human immunodeficiency virus 1]